MSPLTSTMLAAGLTLRTSMVCVGVVIKGLSLPAASRSLSGSRTNDRRQRGARFIGNDAHEIRQAGDLEDFAVVLTQTKRGDGAVLLAGARQHAHDQREAGAVDIGGADEIEQDPP